MVVTFLFFRLWHQMLQLPRQQLDVVQWASSLQMVCINMPFPISKRESQVLGFRWSLCDTQHNWNSDWKWLEKLASSFTTMELYEHCSVLLNSSTLFLIGGNQPSTSPKTYLFNTENDGWGEGPPLITAR